MAKKKESGLGSGLASIFGDNVTDVLEEIQNGSKTEYGQKTTLKLSTIRPNPYQPRKTFDAEKLNELAQSIREHGVFTPILVKKSAAGDYELIAGERRLKASKMAGLTDIPAIIMDFDDKQMMEISLLENIQRDDLNVIEEAQAYEKLMKTQGYTQEELASHLGKSREHLANTLRLLKLPATVQQMVIDNKLSMGHVRPLITLKAEDITEIAQKAVEEGLSVRAVEALAAEKKQPKVAVEKKGKKVDPYIADLQNTLQQKLSSKVKITSSSINISFDDTDDLNRILELLNLID